MKYEYMTTGFLGWTEQEIMSSLNDLALQGWEIVTVPPRGCSGWVAHHSWVLKRREERP